MAGGGGGRQRGAAPRHRTDRPGRSLPAPGDGTASASGWRTGRAHRRDARGTEVPINLALTGALLTDAGRQRPTNEDWAAALAPSRDGSYQGTRVAWAVADGVSGHGTGRDAARLAVETALAVLAEDARPIEAALRDAFSHANRALLDRGRGRRGPSVPYATTLLVAAIEGDRVWVANAGDCRAYLVRDGLARQLTRDHTWVAEQVARGALRPEEAAAHPRRNVITRCLGQQPRLAPDIAPARLRAGDSLVLCSDGLTRHVADREIVAAVEPLAPDRATRALVDLANARGGTDNVTVAVIQVAGEPAAASSSVTPRSPAADRPAPPTPGSLPAGRPPAAGPASPTLLHERILRSVSSGIVTLDRSGIVTSANPAADAMLALPSGVAVGRSLAELVPPVLLRGLGPLFAGTDAELGATVHGADMEGELPGRGHVHFRHRLSPLRDEGGAVVGYVLVLDDETERVRLERERRHADAERERIQAVFERYVAPDVYRELMRRGVDASGIGGEQRELTVLFADIRGFTALAEQLSPAEMVELLNGYLSVATELIFEHNGTIDKFIGDAIMALFGAPVAAPRHPLLAVKAALAMQEAFARLPAGEAGRVSFGIGINTGEGIVGTIGAPRLMSYTVIGDVVNVAARLQGEARAGEVLIADETYRQIGTSVQVEELGSLYVKGRLAPVSTYKVLGLRPDTAPPPS